MEWIDNIILGLLDLYGTNDVYDLCNSLNIKIIKLNHENKLLQENEAFYCRKFLDVEIIFIRNDLPLEYERFILAHELCHAIVHSHISSAAFNISFIDNGKLERQANYFALRINNIQFNSIELYEMTIEQIASSLNIPEKVLNQLSYLIK